MDENQKDKNNSKESDLAFEKKQLLNFFKTLIRRKTIIIFISLIGIFSSSIFAIAKKRVWKGEFQIVLDRKNNISTLSAIDPIFARLALPGKSSQLQTEVEILKSPYVLMSVFEFVKSKYKEDSDDLRFQDWITSLDIKLLRGTKILNIGYEDNDKEMIIDVLNQISKSYQNYSKLSENRNFELGTKFYEEQIEIYKKKSTEILKEIQDYASLHDLNFGIENSSNPILSINQSDLLSSSNQLISKTTSPVIDSLNIEIMNANASNKVKLMEKFIGELNNLDDADDSILYLAMKVLPKDKSIFGSSSEYISIVDELREAKIQLSLKKTIYQENDKSILMLEKKKNRLLKLLKDQTLGYLYSEKNYEENKVRMTNRANEVLVKYKELKNNSIRNKKVLNDLEQGYKLLSLEKAKYEDPWILITKPNLLPYPVAPKRKQIVFIGFSISLILAILLILVDEFRKGIVFYFEQIKKTVDWEFLVSLNSKDLNYKEKLDIFNETSLSLVDKEITFLFPEEVDNQLMKDFKNKIQKIYKNPKLSFTNDFLKVNKLNELIIVIPLGYTKIKSLQNLEDKLKIANQLKNKYIVLEY